MYKVLFYRVKQNNFKCALFKHCSHFDCAPVYLNEKAIGRVLKQWLDSGRVKREDLFITTKLPEYGKIYDQMMYLIQNCLMSKYCIDFVSTLTFYPYLQPIVPSVLKVR